MLIFPRLLGKWARSHRARFSFRLKLKVHCAFAYIRTCKGTHAYASIFSYVRICLRTCVRTSVPMRTHDVQTEAYERVMRTWVRPCILLFLKKESRAKLLVKKKILCPTAQLNYYSLQKVLYKIESSLGAIKHIFRESLYKANWNQQNQNFYLQTLSQSLSKSVAREF